jgi:hypothetical protein
VQSLDSSFTDVKDDNALSKPMPLSTGNANAPTTVIRSATINIQPKITFMFNGIIGTDVDGKIDTAKEKDTGITATTAEIVIDYGKYAFVGLEKNVINLINYSHIPTGDKQAPGLEIYDGSLANQVGESLLSPQEKLKLMQQGKLKNVITKIVFCLPDGPISATTCDLEIL